MPRYARRSWRSFDPAALAPQAAQPATTATPLPRRVLGLDPGSLRTGYGIVDCIDGREIHVASGCVRAGGSDLAVRLRYIHERLTAIIDEFVPDEVAVESVFMHRNAGSALKLGQARGAALSAVSGRGAAVFEYAPRAIKLAIVGTGAADKAQVSHMVQVLLAIGKPATADVSDALAIALCHAQARRAAGRLASLGGAR
ncbi:MAG: crossover junction endodeoxyribonuclease RuvC [Steroidobacteraceae bacterium]